MEMEMKDEDYAYENDRQWRLDNNRLAPKPRLVIGSALPQGERTQKSVRVDPHPEVPFNPVVEKITKLEMAIWAALVGFWLTLVFINPFGWGW
jgi:hypothetical protein